MHLFKRAQEKKKLNNLMKVKILKRSKITCMKCLYSFKKWAKIRGEEQNRCLKIQESNNEKLWQSSFFYWHQKAIKAAKRSISIELCNQFIQKWAFQRHWSQWRITFLNKLNEKKLLSKGEEWRNNRLLNLSLGGLAKFVTLKKWKET